MAVALHASSTSGELPSFAEVYSGHARFVWVVLRRLGVADADLEDVCQEVFTVVHRKLGGFDGRSALRTWIYGIAFRCASEHRRRRRELPVEDIDDHAVDGRQVEQLEQSEARVLLDAILARMDPDQRAVLVLYELEEMPMAEVAEIVGCPLQTAYSRLHAGRRHFEREVARREARERSR